jgi:hypothetical protein
MEAAEYRQSFRFEPVWEVIRRRGAWKNIDDVEFATLEWVDRFNDRRLPVYGVDTGQLVEVFPWQAGGLANNAKPRGVAPWLRLALKPTEVMGGFEWLPRSLPLAGPSIVES